MYWKFIHHFVTTETSADKNKFHIFGHLFSLSEVSAKKIYYLCYSLTFIPDCRRPVVEFVEICG